MAIDFNSITSPVGTKTTKINFGSIVPAKKPTATPVAKKTTESSPEIKRLFSSPPETYSNVPKYQITREEIFNAPSTKISQSTPPSGTAEDAANPKKNTEVLTGPIKSSYNNFVNKLGSVVDMVSDVNKRKIPISEIIGKQTELLTGAVGFALSPVSTAFSVAESLPGVAGIPGKVVNKAFEVSGTVGGYYTSKAIDILPIDDQAKKNLKPAAQEVGSLFGEAILGKLAHSATKKALPDKTAEDIRNDYNNNLKARILEEERPVTPEIAREIATDAAKMTVEKMKSIPEKMTETDRNFKLAETVPQPKEGMVRVYQTGLKKNGLIEKDSFVDTKVKEHVNRGLASEEKVFHDMLRTEFDKLFEKIDDAKTGAGIYKAKENIQGTVYSEAGQTNPTFVPKITNDIVTSFKEKGLVPEEFESLPRVEQFTFAESAKNAVEIVKNDIERVKRIVKGEEPIPQNIQPGFFIDAINEHIIKTKDAGLAMELAKSPILSETSLHAQALTSYRALSKESVPNILSDIKKAREKNAEKKKEAVKKEAREGLKKEIRKTAPKVKDWVEYIETLKCK